MQSPDAAKAASYMQHFIKQHADAIQPDNHDRAFYRSLTVRSVTMQDLPNNISAKCVIHSVIPPTYTNQPADSPNKTTHGGAIAMFFDLTTSLTIVACNFPGWESTGMSRRLDVTYLRPPVEGDDVLFECEVIQIGKRLAVLRGVMKREKDGVLLATCQHDKYLPDKPHYKVKPLKL